MSANTKDADERRRNSRLEVDDPYHCKRCGGELPEIMVDGPIAGEGTEHPPIELCGSCQGDDFTMRVKAVRNAKENHGVSIDPSDLEEPPADWDLSTGLWYDWSAGVRAMSMKGEGESDD